MRILASASDEVEKTVAWLSTRPKRAARAFLFGYGKKLRLLASGMVEYSLSHILELACLTVGRKET